MWEISMDVMQAMNPLSICTVQHRWVCDGWVVGESSRSRCWLQVSESLSQFDWMQNRATMVLATRLFDLLATVSVLYTHTVCSSLRGVPWTLSVSPIVSDSDIANWDVPSKCKYVYYYLRTHHPFQIRGKGMGIRTTRHGFTCRLTFTWIDMKLYETETGRVDEK